MAQKNTLRTCKNGHPYYKSTDCPACPICEAQKKSTDNFLSTLGAPARRALESIGVVTVQQLAKHSLEEILSLHGMGPASLPKLLAALKDAGLFFKEK